MLAMEQGLLDRAAKKLLTKKRRKRWLSVVGVMACAVVFCTTYALILPAITVANETDCGLEEHTHSESCYVQETVPGELQLDCDEAAIGVHSHENACYDGNHNAICGYADYLVHTHTDACYEAGALV